MKKNIFFLCFSAALFTVCSFGQTKVASHTLKLAKPVHFQQLLHAVNERSNEVFVFAADKESLCILRLNAALFVTDEFKTERPDKNLFMAGYDFTPEGLPVVYWANSDYEEITAMQYDTENKKQRALPSVEGTNGDRIVSAFSNAEAFFILTFSDKNDNHLLLRRYDNGQYSKNTVDFTGARLQKSNGSAIKISTLLENQPVEYIDTREWQPLYQVTRPVKLYVDGHRATLTFDIGTTDTQAMDIDLNTSEVAGRTFPSVATKKTKTNSYLYNHRLYQISTAKEKLDLRIYDYQSGQLLNEFSATTADTIAFRNSPLFSQTGNRPAQDLKSSKRFLKKLSGATPGVSVYSMPGYDFLTIGGTRSSVNAAQMAFGISLGVGVVLSGGNSDFYFGELFGEPTDLQNIYFETMLDQQAQLSRSQSMPLYIDHLSDFLSANRELNHARSFPYKDYFLLGYLDPVKGEYVLRKFENGFYEPFSANVPQ